MGVLGADVRQGLAGQIGRVLIIGRDASVLEIQASLLGHFWLVRTRDESSPALHLDETGLDDTDLIVVAASVPASERQGVIDAIRHAAPTLLVVRVNGFDSGPHAGADATVDEAHGPGGLVATIYELLTERGLSSLGWPLSGEAAWIQ